MLKLITYIPGTLLILLGSMMSIVNWGLFVAYFRDPKTKGSAWPFFAGLLIIGGIRILPNETARSFWWLGLIIDGAYPMTVLFALRAAYRWAARSLTQ